MRKLDLKGKIIVSLFIGAILLFLGFAIAPAWWFMFLVVPVALYGVYYGSQHGWKFWQTKKAFEQKYVKTMTVEQAQQKIREFCYAEDIIVVKKSPKEGEKDFPRIAGRFNIPFYVMERCVSQSKQKEGWAYLVCDRSNGAVSILGLGNAAFTRNDLDKELDKMGGGLQFIERIVMPMQQGPTYERVRVNEPVAQPEGENNA